MKNQLVANLSDFFKEKPFAFLTADLGYRTFESLEKQMGKYFINVGISEQHMVSMAAGMVKSGLSTWIYSIAPFLYARAFEQIRNDVAMNQIPVKLIGNGGGYAYGINGPSHHALEDYGVLQSLGMNVYVPAFNKDIVSMMRQMNESNQSSYLRLGRSECAKNEPKIPFAPWQKVTSGKKLIVVAVGALASGIYQELLNQKKDQQIGLWVVSQLPITDESIPQKFEQEVRQAESWLMVEEHVLQASVGSSLVYWLSSRGITTEWHHLYALGYPSGHYGNSDFHRTECNLSAKQIVCQLVESLNFQHVA